MVGLLLSDRDVGHVLAALRMFQKEKEEFRNAMPHFEDMTPMDNEEVDDLCERINLGVPHA